MWTIDGSWDFSIRTEEALTARGKGEADAIYTDVQCDGPFDYCYSVEQFKAKFKVRARHETVNRRFKQFGILGTKFRHPKEKHVHVFMAIAVITQITIKNGHPLFPVNYRTYNGS